MRKSGKAPDFIKSGSSSSARRRARIRHAKRPRVMGKGSQQVHSERREALALEFQAELRKDPNFAFASYYGSRARK